MRVAIYPSSIIFSSILHPNIHSNMRIFLPKQISANVSFSFSFHKVGSLYRHYGSSIYLDTLTRIYSVPSSPSNVYMRWI